MSIYHKLNYIETIYILNEDLFENIINSCIKKNLFLTFKKILKKINKNNNNILFKIVELCILENKLYFLSYLLKIFPNFNLSQKEAYLFIRAYERHFNDICILFLKNHEFKKNILTKSLFNSKQINELISKQNIKSIANDF